MEKAISWRSRGKLWRGQALWPALLALGYGAGLLVFNAEPVSWGVQGLISQGGVLLGSVALMLLPGLAVLELLWHADRLRLAERLALAWGISVALPPLCLELWELLGLPWNRWTTVGYLLLSAAVLAARWRRQMWEAWQASKTPELWILLALAVVALLVRLYIVRELPVGLWGDSYHHTMIAQLLVDNGGLFRSWEPYAPLTTFTYHYGFHANAAFFHWLTGVPVTRSVVLVGQVLNAATLAVAYVLTTRFTGSRSAGLWAAVLTGFVNEQPAFYVNWGRYTQLSGQVILPVALICWHAALESERWSWRRIGLAAGVTATLMLTHYIVTIFAALLLLGSVLVLLVRRPHWHDAAALLARSFVTGGLALLLAAPWLLRTLSGFLGRNLGGSMQAPAAIPAASDSLLLPIVPTYIGGGIMALAFVGLLLAAARRDWRAGLLALWSWLLVFSIVPHTLGLPGTGVVTQFAGYIALYLTVVPLAGFALGAAQTWIARRWTGFGAALCVGALLAVSIWGARWQQALIDPFFQLFTAADAAAMDWIATETPPDARFAVNSIPAYGDTLIAGTDGGWWIPLLTGRSSNLPPITYGSERAATDDFADRVNALGFALREQPLPAPAAVQLLRENGIRFVYSGAHVGQPDRFDVEALRGSADFATVYDRDGVVIFELVPAAEPQP